MTNTTQRDDFLNGLPWWLKGILVIGPLTAIALGLVYSDRVQLQTSVAETRAIVGAMVLTDASHDLKVTAQFIELSKVTAETNRILVAACVNAAQGEAQRNACMGR